MDYADAGTTMVGHGPTTPMEVFSAGTTYLDELPKIRGDAHRSLLSPGTFD